MPYAFTTETVEYIRHGGTPYMMKLYKPSGDGPFPMIVDLHGGAWCNGDLADCDARDQVLAASGFVVFRIFGELLQLVHSLIASLWNTRHHVADHRLGFRVENRRHRHTDFVGTKRCRQMIRLRDIGLFERLLGTIHRDTQAAQRMEVRFDRFLERRGRKIESLHNRFVDGNFLVQHQIEVNAGFRKSVLVDQVMHNHPRLREPS